MVRKAPIILTLMLSLLIASGQIFSQTKQADPAGKARPVEVFPAAPVELTEEQQKRLEAFETVWQTIKDNYFDQTFNGLNWDNVKKEFRPRVLQAKTSFQFYSLLQEMINRLNRSHFFIIPPEVSEALEKAKVAAKQKSPARNGDGSHGAEDG